MLLVLLSPLMLLIAAGVKLGSPGPAIFRQRRNGLDGEEIVVYKFRSMRVQENGAQVRQATRDDPRVTPFGAFLRRTSLDELPQFINVLQGRMSIVGPRPHAVAHNEQPPTDVVNAALGYGYAIALGQAVSACAAVGLDGAAGLLHADHERRESMALDLLEEFRP